MASVLFEQVRVFDGDSDRLTDPVDVLVRGNVIAAVGAAPAPEPDEDRQVIDGRGRVLMPGLIDAHHHSMFSAAPLMSILGGDLDFLALQAAPAAEATLMRGFTSVRDAGGPAFGLRAAIDVGLARGPRIWPSGAMVSQTSGHGDFRLVTEVPRGVCGHLTHTEIIGATAIADGVPEVLRAVREQLMKGASQIKLMAGGGVASMHDPLDVTQYTEAELRAAVDAAEDWGTYVMVHAYTPRAIERAVRSGVRSIEHGQLADEATVALMAERGTWWSLQPFLADEHANVHPSPANRAKQLEVAEGTDRAYEMAIEHGVNVAWGTDVLFDPAHAATQGAQLAKMTRWLSPAEVLRMATSRNGELLQLSGARSPYPGRLGVVAEGALADLLLVDGDPLADISLVARPQEAFTVIMKNGVVVKG